VSSAATAAQKGRGPLAVLRRAKNVKNASETERNALLEDAEHLESWCAWLVLYAILFEVVVWIAPLCPLLFKMGNALSDGAVALGILGEMRFGQVAGNILKIMLAEAVERAAQADLARAKLEAKFAYRHLTKDQYEALQTLKGAAPTVCITTVDNLEAKQFGQEIAHALRSVGIDVIIGMPRIGNAWPGIHVAMPPPLRADLRDEPFVKAFRLAGLSVGCSERPGRSSLNLVDLPPGTPVIMVGEKPVPSDEPPYVAGLA
jgi:hypothetical protein